LVASEVQLSWLKTCIDLKEERKKGENFCMDKVSQIMSLSNS
jgi:hypothetical protein